MSIHFKTKPPLRGLIFVIGLISAACLGAVELFDSSDRWSKDERAVLASMQLSQLRPAPPDPTNPVERRPEAVELGKKIFSDTRFSGNGKVSCASCHDPKKQFQDDRPLGVGVGTGARRTMPLVGAHHSPFLFWDGRKDSLWAQALGPLEDPMEHGGNRVAYVRVLHDHYRSDYERLFRALPDMSRLPQNAGPLGSAEQRAAWNRMDPSVRQEVSQAFANMGKVLAAFQITLSFGESRLDRYIGATLAGNGAASGMLTAQEKNGLRIFINKGQCVTCHNGPLLSDGHFHNTGVPPLNRALPDLGRAAAIAKVKGDEFNCLGPFAGAKPGQCEELRFMATDDPLMAGAFKTPILRNVALRPPYKHAGQVASLADVVTHYVRAPEAVVGKSERKPMKLSAQEQSDLVAFLGTLSGPIVEAKPGK